MKLDVLLNNALKKEQPMENQLKVLFVIKQLDFADHIAIPYLSAMAKQLGWNTDLCILDNTDLSDKIGLYRPDVVAYSANILSFDSMVSSNQAARKKYQFVSIMGGPHPTFSPETFPMSGMDAYCMGEGELAFRDFLMCVEDNRAFDDIRNLITTSRRNDVRNLIEDLDSLPFPDRDITLSGTYLKNTPKKTFYTTRGCPFNCNYCCNNHYKQLYHGKGRLVRRFSVERILKEIEFVQSHYRMDFIKFGDDLFAVNADDWLLEFSEAYSRRIGIPFNCYLRFDRVDPELLRLLKKAGCYSVHLSVDSTSEFVREKVLGRKMRKVDIAKELTLINSFGINTWVNYMLAAPESSLEDDLATIALNKKSKVTYAAYSTTVPMKGTRLYEYCIDRKLIDPESHIGDMNGCTKMSTLNSISDREKKIRYNIFLLGAVIAKLPFPLDRFALMMIKIIPPNRFFIKIREIYYQYFIENKIFNLHWRESRSHK